MIAEVRGSDIEAVNSVVVGKVVHGVSGTWISDR